MYVNNRANLITIPDISIGWTSVFLRFFRLKIELENTSNIAIKSD